VSGYSGSEIASPLKPNPNGLRSREAIALAIEKTTEAGNHAHHLIE
jgi:hypothetical protein